MLYYADNVLISSFALFGIFAVWGSVSESRRIWRLGSPHEIFGPTDKLFFAGAFMLFAARAIYYMQQHAT